MNCQVSNEIFFAYFPVDNVNLWVEIFSQVQVENRVGFTLNELIVRLTSEDEYGIDFVTSF